ncbi:MAG: IclR family transcriptional regulator [Burkholderiaceae bacterium]
MNAATPRRTASKPQPAQRSDFVESLAKGLEILSLFAHGDLLGNQQIVERCGMPRATVSRLTRTLATLGYLRHDAETGKYSMGTRVLGMGASVQRNMGLIRAARPFMQTLAEDADLTVTVGTRDRLGIVYLEVVRPVRNRLTINNDAGTVLPIAQTAIGLAYIVAAPMKERVKLLESLRRRHGAEWSTLRQSIDRAHDEFRREGFVTSIQSWSRQINAVAVPMLLSESRRLFSFNCAGPSSELPPVRLRSELGPRLVETVAAIRRQMLAAPLPRLAPPSVHVP